eukprot:gene28353-31480_t
MAEHHLCKQPPLNGQAGSQTTNSVHLMGPKHQPTAALLMAEHHLQLPLMAKHHPSHARHYHLQLRRLMTKHNPHPPRLSGPPRQDHLQMLMTKPKQHPPGVWSHPTQKHLLLSMPNKLAETPQTLLTSPKPKEIWTKTGPRVNVQDLPSNSVDVNAGDLGVGPASSVLSVDSKAGPRGSVLDLPVDSVHSKVSGRNGFQLIG